MVTQLLNQLLYKHNEISTIKERCFYYGWSSNKCHVTANSYFSDLEILFLAICSC
jgi:hypothetical protein